MAENRNMVSILLKFTIMVHFAEKEHFCPNLTHSHKRFLKTGLAFITELSHEENTTTVKLLLKSNQFQHNLEGILNAVIENWEGGDRDLEYGRCHKTVFSE